MPKPPKRWIPPTDEQMRQIFGPKWGERERPKSERAAVEAVAREIQSRNWDFAWVEIDECAEIPEEIALRIRKGK